MGFWVENRRKSQINVRIIIVQSCCHIGQPTVAFVLPGIIIKLLVGIWQVLISNPVSVGTYLISVSQWLIKNLVIFLFSEGDSITAECQPTPHPHLIIILPSITVEATLVQSRGTCPSTIIQVFICLCCGS